MIKLAMSPNIYMDTRAVLVGMIEVGSRRVVAGILLPWSWNNNPA